MSSEEPGTASGDVVYDCAIIGGGPAGLSAALYLGRLKRHVLVIDDSQGRSTWHQVNRNYLGFPDGVHATALRELGEQQARKYGGRFVDARAVSARIEGEGKDQRFVVVTTAGEYVSRTLILAMGVTDRFPEFPGSVECIGKSMFWCIICDGFESIGKRVVVLGHGDRAAALALQLLVFTDKVTLVSWDDKMDIPVERLEALRQHGIAVHDCGCEIYRCEQDGQLRSLTLGDGTELTLEMLFVVQHIEPNTQLANELGATLDEQGYIIVDSEQATNVAGLYAAGDVTKLFNHQVTSAVHEGGMAAAGANYYLYDDWQKD